jgi:hypothetical protein
MKIPAGQLATGDILHVNDWRLHVIAVERDLGTAVLTEEFDFLLHFGRDETIDVVATRDIPAAVA